MEPKTISDYQTALLSMGVEKNNIPKTKSLLEEMYESLTKKEKDSIKIDFEPQPTPAQPSTMAEALPEYGSIEWQKYIVGLLRPDEVIDGFPKGAGLRRVANLVLGPIVKSGATVVSVVPQLINGDTPSRAVTINYEITINWKLNRSVMVSFGSTQPAGEYRTFAGVSDCVEDARNVFGKHPAASAESKAESRALKKALGLNVLSFEERISGYEETTEIEKPENRISTQLREFIGAKIEILKLDPKAVLREFGSDQTSLHDLSMDEGRKLFQFINSYQQRS